MATVALLDVSSDLRARNIDLSQALGTLSVPKLARAVLVHAISAGDGEDGSFSRGR